MIRTASLYVLATLAVSLFTVRAAIPAINGWQTATILTSSMKPALNPGDLVYIDTDAAYQVGDTVTFRAESGDLISHKIVGDWVGDGSGPFRMQGIANTTPDAQLVARDNILGKVVGNIPWVGYASQTLTLLPVIAFVLLAAFALLVWPMLLEPRPAFERRHHDNITAWHKAMKQRSQRP